MFSILIPSLRSERLKECVNAIKENTKERHEILVNTDIGGTYQAVRKMYKEAKGEYIVHIPDDCTPLKDWLEEPLEMMKRNTGLYEVAIRSRNEWDIHKEHCYFGKPFAAFICMRKDDIDSVGGLIDERYSSFYGDPDLSMRVWNNGGNVEYTQNPLIHYYDKEDYIKSYNKSLYEEKDKQAFMSKWCPIFGDFGGCTTR